MIYQLNNLTKTYAGKTVLNIDSLQVDKAKIYALLGPNGSGKTTLLRILAFLDMPTTGEINYRSNPVTFSRPVLSALRKEVVMVNQRPVLFTTTVYKNLEFGLKIRKLDKDTRKRRIMHSLERVGLEHLAHEPAQNLSGGETQRIAIARALALSPKVILCDEPTSNVDFENQSVIMNLLKKIHRDKQISIIFTTHDRLQAASLAQQTIFLDHGKLTTSLYENLFTAEVTRTSPGKGDCHIQGLTKIEIPAEKSGTVRVLIDPEKIKLVSKSRSTEARASVKGTVTQVSLEKETVRVIVESKTNLTVSIPGDVYREQQIMVGDEVGIIIGADSIREL